MEEKKEMIKAKIEAKIEAEAEAETEEEAKAIAAGIAINTTVNLARAMRRYWSDVRYIASYMNCDISEARVLYREINKIGGEKQKNEDKGE